MMKRYWLNRVKNSSLGLVAGITLIVAGLPSPASAQIVQVSRGDARNSVGFNLGYFAVRGEDVRIDDDVLLANLDDLAFEIGDFSGFSFGGEWLYGIGDFIEAGVGVNYYQKTVPSLYRDFVDVDGTEILQDLKLRVLPITATVRFLPSAAPHRFSHTSAQELGFSPGATPNPESSSTSPMAPFSAIGTRRTAPPSVRWCSAASVSRLATR